MSNAEISSIFIVAFMLAGWKILTMSNVPWWACTAVTGVYALLLFIVRVRSTKDSE